MNESDLRKQIIYLRSVLTRIEELATDGEKGNVESLKKQFILIGSHARLALHQISEPPAPEPEPDIEDFFFGNSST